MASVPSDPSSGTDSLAFLADGGEMGERMRGQCSGGPSGPAAQS